MGKFFSKIWGFFAGLATRPGLDTFLKKYMDLAISIVAELQQVHTNADFHVWKDLAWERLKLRTGELRGNWIAILVSLAFESLKAKQEK